MRKLVAVLAAVVVAAATSCTSDDNPAHPYAAQMATIGESVAVLGWNLSVTNLRFDADYVLVDVDAAPAQAGGAHAKPEDLRFGLYGALAARYRGIRPVAALEAVQVRASLCTQGDINEALLYATVSLVGTHAGLWTTRE